jgi:hypothetical protein
MLGFLLNPVLLWQITSAGSPDVWDGTLKNFFQENRIGDVLRAPEFPHQLVGLVKELEREWVACAHCAAGSQRAGGIPVAEYTENDHGNFILRLS